MQEKEIGWANPSSAGIVGLCCGVIPLVVLKIGWIDPAGAPVLLAWLLFSGLLQVVCGIIEARRGGLMFATPFLILGFMVTMSPALGEIIKIWIKAPAVPATVSGVGFVVVAVWAIALFIGVGLISKFLFVLIGILDVSLWLLGLSMLGVLGKGADLAGSYLLLIFTVGMLYVSCALFLNESFGKQVLPIGSPLFKNT